ncbi:hypothetical protein G6F56_000965 [Rhizopus delemar]|nr:hypothetical protein G6F56_000965 [Rhizopus delemar]
MYNLLNSYDNAESVYSKDESLFIERALDPSLNAIFPIGGTMTRDGHFISLIRNSDLKPNVKFSAKVGSKIFDFLIFEVKCPNSVAKDDLFKMSLELQLIINRMIANKVSKPVDYGVVGQGAGFDYDVYRMELVAPLVYLPIKVRSFYLPRSTCDLTVALTTIPTLLQLQQLTCNQPLSAAYADAAGYRKIGLKYDDLVAEENEIVKEALRRLEIAEPRAAYDRAYRIRVAQQLSLSHQLLPKNEWVKSTEDIRYLQPYIEQISAERAEREAFDNIKVSPRH